MTLLPPWQCPYLDDNQKRCLIRMLDGDTPNVFIAWWKMGTGKTRLGLAAFDYSGYDDLILVCRRISFDDWILEMETCGLDYMVFENNYNPSSIVRFAHTKNPRRVLLVSAGDLKSVPEYYPKGQMLIVDELYLFGNPQSRRSTLIQRISLFCSARLGLSGTIMPAGDNSTIFGQCMALQAHRFLAPTLSKFKGKFQMMAKGRYGKKFLQRPGANEEITKLLAPMVDVYMPEGRPTVKQILSCAKNKKQANAIAQLQDEYEYGNTTYDYALQIVHVVNGISNGWHDHGESVEFLPSTKCEKTLALIDDLVSSGERVVVWCAYHNDIARISSELKHPWLEFTARVPFDRTTWEKGDVKVVLATEANGASVNHFAHVKYAIYYSLNYKLLDLQQSMMRHERKNSEHDGTHYYFMQTRGSFDARAHYLVTESDKSEKELVMSLVGELFPN